LFGHLCFYIDKALDNLVEALKKALESVTLNDINNWFYHDGYATEKILAM
jgi:hypothetical protein